MRISQLDAIWLTPKERRREKDKDLRGAAVISGLSSQLQDLDNDALVLVDVHKDLLMIWYLTDMARGTHL